MLRQIRIFGRACYELFKDSGFSMAGAVAFSFVLSAFPFCIFLGALAATFGGQELAQAAVEHLFMVAPPRVAEVLAPEIEAVMSHSRFGLLTIGGAICLFFATSAIESLRHALNVAYRVHDSRSYLWCLGQSTLFVFASAIGMLALAWGVVVGPTLLGMIKPAPLRWLLDQDLLAVLARYGIVVLITGGQLWAYHVWLAAGERRFADVWPGVVLSVVLWLIAAALYSRYLDFSDYSRFYAGLSQLMAALIFFEVTGIIVILGAEYNRAAAEMRRVRALAEAMQGDPLPPTSDSFTPPE